MARSALPSVLLCMLLTGAASLAAQDSSTFQLGLAGGIGGSFDGEGDDDYDHHAWQASAGMLTNDRTWAIVRVGQLDFREDLFFEDLRRAELLYVTVAGEYRFRQPSYDYGIYLGLGGYQLSGRDPFGDRVDERAFGLALGITGDFDVSRHWSVVAEIATHYAFLERANLYGLALGGVTFHF